MIPWDRSLSVKEHNSRLKILYATQQRPDNRFGTKPDSSAALSIANHKIF